MKKYKRRVITVEAYQYEGLDYHATIEVGPGEHEDLMCGDWVVQVPGATYPMILSDEEFRAQHRMGSAPEPEEEAEEEEEEEEPEEAEEPEEEEEES